MNKKINALLLIGIIGTTTAGFQFAAKYGQVMWGNKDIWWTPMSLALPLHKTTQEFQIFINGELLHDHLDHGSLAATDKAGQSHRVVSDDIKIRLNNWYKTEASLLHSAVFAAFLLGSSLTFLILGIAQLAARREKAC
ncbi:MAG: hypothetical protein EHM85_05725 [Desulfobacteraceae bacterium]|nr:MAG: hypothetical protein EHM85_05725 [Desulfobacteraceae bacterium]